MDYAAYLPNLLLLAGGLLQWLRAARKFTEYTYVGIAVSLTLACFFLTADYTHPFRQVVLDGLSGLWPNLRQVLSGTAVVSVAANLAALAGAPKGSFAVPVTNSK
jgi:hypothetical protein